MQLAISSFEHIVRAVHNFWSLVKPFFFSLAGGCALCALVSSLWWTYGGESAGALVATFAMLGVAGLLAFVGGARGEIQRWEASASPPVRGIVSALAAVAATLVGILVVNFQTEAGRPALAAPTGTREQWLALVSAEAQESDNGRVISILCDKVTGRSTDAVTCAVTYEGPVCQLWFVGDADGTNEARSDDMIESGRAVYYESDTGAYCDWPLPEFP